jgi:hypothetical protein
MLDMNIEIESRLEKCLIDCGFRRSRRDSLFCRKLDRYRMDIVSIDKSNNVFDIKYGLRLNNEFKILGNIFESTLPNYIDNPFYQKWCVLIHIPILPNLYLPRSNVMLESILEIFQFEVRRITAQLDLKDAADIAEHSWNSKRFDGLSKYTIPFTLLNSNKYGLAHMVLQYFHLVDPGPDRSIYERNIINIMIELGIDRGEMGKLMFKNYDDNALH